MSWLSEDYEAKTEHLWSCVVPCGGMCSHHISSDPLWPTLVLWEPYKEAATMEGPCSCVCSCICFSSCDSGPNPNSHCMTESNHLL